jgi:hypothetical protein
MEPMADIPVEAAAEVALDIAMSIEDVDMCDISILVGERVAQGEGRVGGTTKAFQPVDGLKRAVLADERRFDPDGQFPRMQSRRGARNWQNDKDHWQCQCEDSASWTGKRKQAVLLSHMLSYVGRSVFSTLTAV